MALSEMFSDMGDRLKKIPPWGWGAISVGVLGLVVYNSKKGGSSSGAGQMNYMVDPLAQQTGSNIQDQIDTLSQTLTDRINQVGQTSKENYQDLNDSLHTIEDAVNQHANSNPTVITTNPTPAPSILDQLTTLQGTINQTQEQLGKNFNDTNATRNYLHQQKIALATKAGWTVDSFGHVFDQNGNRVNIGQQA